MAKVKCPKCGLYFFREDEEYIHYKNRYWHKKCYEDKEKDLDELKEYICQLFEIEYVVPLIMRQVNKYHKEFNYSYTGIKQALFYFFEIRKNSVKTHGLTIGIVPYVYDTAQEYFNKIQKAQERNLAATVENLKKFNQEVTCVISSPIAKTKGIKTINLDALEKELR